jgi:ketosteroid isomerase-like protein
MSATDVVARYFACLNGEDWDGMGRLWHDDAELRAVAARKRHGRDEVVDYFSRLFTPWQVHHDEPVRVVQGSVGEVDVVTVEVTFTGTTPNGRDVTFEAVDVFDVVDGRIKRFSNWYDIDFARRELTVEAS